MLMTPRRNSCMQVIIDKVVVVLDWIGTSFNMNESGISAIDHATGKQVDTTVTPAVILSHTRWGKPSPCLGLFLGSRDNIPSLCMPPDALNTCFAHLKQCVLLPSWALEEVEEACLLSCVVRLLPVVDLSI